MLKNIDRVEKLNIIIHTSKWPTFSFIILDKLI